MSRLAAASLPPGSPVGRLEPGQLGGPADAAAIAPQLGEGGDQPAQPAGGVAAGRAARPAGAGPFELPPGLPPLLSPDYAVNALLTRVAFDLLRRPDFQVGWLHL
jgi:hypothetical protein